MEQRKQIRLRTCPWCGCTGGLNSFLKKFFVECTNEQCGLSGPCGDTPDAAVRLWNGLEGSERPSAGNPSLPLKSCPWCGSKDVHCIGREGNPGTHVECNGCGAMGPQAESGSPNDACEMWNALGSSLG